MKNNWQAKKLGDIAVINGGGTPPTNNTEYFVGDIPWFTPSEITSGTVSVLNNSQRQITGEAMRFTKVAEQGTVLLSSRATIGNVGIVSNRSTYNQGIKGITPKEELNPWYLAYWLLGNKKRLEQSSHGTTFKELSSTALKRFDITIPPISTQQQIVEKLNAIRKLQELNNKEVEKAEELYLTLANRFFSDKTIKAQKIRELVTTFQYGLSRVMNTDGKGKPILRINSIVNGEIVEEDVKYADVTPEEFKKYKADYNDVLFNRTNSYELVGKTGIFKLQGDYLFASYLIRLKTKEELLPDYLNYFLNSPRGQAEIRKKAKRAVSQANVNAKELGSIQIPLPNIKQQQVVVNKLDGLKEYLKILRNKQDKLSELFESTLNKAMKD